MMMMIQADNSMII